MPIALLANAMLASCDSSISFKVGVKLVVAHARQHRLDVLHHPALAAIEEGDTLSHVGDRHAFAVKRAHVRRRLGAELFHMAQQHAAPFRFVALHRGEKIADRAGAGLARAFQRDARPGALRFEQFVEEGDDLGARRIAGIDVVGLAEKTGGRGIFGLVVGHRELAARMVGTTGIEPVTPAMSRQCSPAELRAHPPRKRGYNVIPQQPRKSAAGTRFRRLPIVELGPRLGVGAAFFRPRGPACKRSAPRHSRSGRGHRATPSDRDPTARAFPFRARGRARRGAVAFRGPSRWRDAGRNRAAP